MAKNAEGRETPRWFTFPEVTAELKRSYIPPHPQGISVLFTGLTGLGKLTNANVLMVKLLEMGGRPVTWLDGDIVCKHLSSEFGFSKAHRNLNIRRICYVAAEITKTAESPFVPPSRHRSRSLRRVLHGRAGRGAVLVYMATPVAFCEQRDRKGLYAKARVGLLPEFTGIPDPYEVPANADVVLDTTALTPEEAAQEIRVHLERAGYIGANGE